jgi:hypothetical protein
MYYLGFLYLGDLESEDEKLIVKVLDVDMDLYNTRPQRHSVIVYQ